MYGLRQAREVLGRSPAKAAAQLIAAARHCGIMLPVPDTLKSQLSRWENGRVELGEAYRELFREIYDCTDEQLGLTPLPRRAEQLASQILTRLATARVAGATAALAYAQQVDEIRVLDQEMGGLAAWPSSGRSTRPCRTFWRTRCCLAPASPLSGAGRLAGPRHRGSEQAWKLHKTAEVAPRGCR
jgi:hypothetical protein